MAAGIERFAEPVATHDDASGDGAGADLAIITTDAAHRITGWSAGAERMLGWPAEAIYGESIARLYPPEDQALARWTAAGERWHVRSDGSRLWAASEALPLRDGAGGHLGFVTVLRDRSAERDALSEAEARLRESDEHFRHTVELNPQVTWTADPQGNITSYSRRWLELTGQAGGEPAGDGWLKALHPDDVDATRAALAASLKSGEPVDVAYRIRGPHDPDYRWMRARAMPRFDESGAIIRWYGVVEDDHARKTAEIALRESEEQFRAFAQAVPSHLWAANPDGELYWFNEQLYAYAGVAQGALDGVGWASIVHPEDEPAVTATWARSLARGEVYETEYRIRRADGEYRWFLVRAEPVRSLDGAIVRWIGTNTDIHERKLAETAAARLYQRAWELSPVLKMVVSLDGTLLSINPGLTQALGWEAADVVGRPAADLLAAADRATSPERRGRLLAGESLPDYQVTMLAKDGGERTVSWTTVIENDSIYAFGRDVTVEREQAEALAKSEEALRQAQKMEAVGQLTGGLAHDFNNLLTAVTGGLELLQHRLAQGRFDNLDRYVAMARTGADRAAAVTQRLLAFSRRQTLAPTPTDVDRLVAGMQDIIVRSSGPAIDVKTFQTPHLWPVLVDAPQLENALLNLCINARDAMPEAGTIVIETANTTLDAAAAEHAGLTSGDYVVLSVTDTGTGMPPEVIDRVFEPFFTTKPIGSGTGLGLSMIYGFVRQSGGQVRIYSEVGTGTTMRLYLPRLAGVHDVADVPAMPAARVRARQGQTILLVEDEAAIRNLAGEVLGEAGYRVLTAGTGADGVAIMQSDERIDLLVTDVGLPGGLNGRQVADAGRAVRPGLKVLFVTGYAANAAVGAGQLEEGMAVLTKPFNVRTLEQRVGEIIGA